MSREIVLILDFEVFSHHELWQISIGIESGNQNVLQFIKRGITLEKVKNVTSWCRQQRIRTTGFLMIGHHIDTPETIQQAIEHGTSLPLSDAIFSINTPIPGTESHDIAK